MWQSQVDKFVKEFTDLGKIFTAYDVTKAVQEEQLNSGITQPTRHLEMRNYIHDKVCAVSGYMRKLQSLPNGVEAYQYKPMATGGLISNSVGNIPVNFNVSASKFLSAVDDAANKLGVNNPPTPKTGFTLNQVQQVATKPLGLIAPFSQINAATQKFYICKPDKRGSISIPNALVRKLPANTEKVDVFYSLKGNLFIEPNSGSIPNVGNFITSYTIDSHRNVRVTRKTLNKLNKSGPYSVSFLSGEITIE